MMDYIVERNDGYVTIMQVVDDGADPQEIIKSWHPDTQAQVVSVHKSVALPDDPMFFNAWKHDGKGGIVVHMPKARDIHRANLRIARAPILADLDVKSMRAAEDGDTKAQAAIVVMKKKLRDITIDPAIEAAKTPDELKLITVDRAIGSL